jgi:hypothetical protein
VHGKHEEETGQPDPDWPDWYAQSMVDERPDRPGPPAPFQSAALHS